MSQAITGHALFRLGWWIAVCVGVAPVMYKLFEAQTPLARRWLRTRLGGSDGTVLVAGSSPQAAQV